MAEDCVSASACPCALDTSSWLKAAARDDPYERPAPLCEQHQEPYATRTAGANAMPHNVGREFHRCPRGVKGCTWQWTDGSLPGSEEAQARFRRHVSQYGTDGYVPEQIGSRPHWMQAFFGDMW